MRKYHRIRVVNLNLDFLEDVSFQLWWYTCVYVDYVYDFVCTKYGYFDSAPEINLLTWLLQG